MPPIELGHNLKCQKKHHHPPMIYKRGPFGWEQEEINLGIETLHKAPHCCFKGHYQRSSVLKLQLLSKLLVDKVAIHYWNHKPRC
jgi:hypothetical protein